MQAKLQAPEDDSSDKVQEERCKNKQKHTFLIKTRRFLHVLHTVSQPNITYFQSNLLTLRSLVQKKYKQKNILIMATLQKLRNMGPRLVIFVGLALFAFVAGDAVKLFDTRSSDNVVGIIGDKEIDVMEYQEFRNMFDCFCEVLGYDNLIDPFRNNWRFNFSCNDNRERKN